METTTSRAPPDAPEGAGENGAWRRLSEDGSDLAYVYRVEPDPGFVAVSPSATRITGYRPDEFRADPDLLLRITHPHDQDLTAALLRAPDLFPESLVIRLIHRTGDVVWTEHAVSPVIEADSREVAVEGLARDITDRARAERELWRTVQTLRRTEEDRRTLLSMLVHAEERERARLAADLHDDAVQALTAALMRLDVLGRNRMADWAEGELEGIHASLRHAIERLRSRIFELLPPEIEREGLPACLRQLLNKLATDTGVECSLEVRIERELAPTIGAMLYRIALEAVVNIRKHAGARRIRVVLEDRDERLVMRIEDDGSGFLEDSDGTARGHFGLRGMRERARLMGGRLSIESSPGSGTVVEAWVPRGAVNAGR
jgi:PAS domain S-box-containing protein